MWWHNRCEPVLMLKDGFFVYDIKEDCPDTKPFGTARLLDV